MGAIVAIIGRPNVGKSTLFNRMLVKDGSDPIATAITEMSPGVTRDRNYGRAQWDETVFTIVDTGGFFGEKHDGKDTVHNEIVRQIMEQALLAAHEADLVIHLCDGKDGLTPSDVELANLLRESGNKILRVVNKIDGPTKADAVLDFYRTGSEDIIPVSALTGYGFDELMEKIIGQLPHEEAIKDVVSDRPSIPKVAVVGRPNVGKSTLINSLLSKQRLIVASTPGTTRDSIDSICTYYGKKYLFIDTAGIRRKADSYTVEGFSVIRTIKSMERSDIVIVIFDASQGLVEQDQRIAGMAIQFGKGLIALFNKWDLMKDPEKDYKRLVDETKQKMWFMDHVPFMTTSGLQKKRITRIFPLIDEIINEREKRIPTPVLNRFLSKLSASRPFPSYKGREVKLLYVAQTGTTPPAFTIFVNYPSAFSVQQSRYVEKALRKEYSFKGTPIKIYFKSR
ncbi:MAG: ribosome biogenesis GTPase Der [Dissulfurispiraceae bacterium]